MNQPPNKNDFGKGGTEPQPTASGAGTPPSPVSPSPKEPYVPVFTTDKIQHTKAAGPREYFDEQNKKTAEREQKDKKNRKTLIIVLIATAVILGIVIAIWAILIHVNKPHVEPAGKPLPNITSDSNESVKEVQDYLQNAYDDTDSNEEDSNAKLEAADKLADEILEHSENSKYTSQVFLAKILFYLSNGYYEQIIANANKVNVDDLTLDQKLSFYNCLALAYQEKGDQQKSNEYFDLTFQIAEQLTGDGEHGDE